MAEEHNILGYAGQGRYRCKCGCEFKVVGDGALMTDTGQDSSAGIRALKDQWEAHKKEVINEAQSQRG